LNELKLCYNTNFHLKFFNQTSDFLATIGWNNYLSRQDWCILELYGLPKPKPLLNIEFVEENHANQVQLLDTKNVNEKEEIQEIKEEESQEIKEEEIQEIQKQEIQEIKEEDIQEVQEIKEEETKEIKKEEIQEIKNVQELESKDEFEKENEILDPLEKAKKDEEIKKLNKKREKTEKKMIGKTVFGVRPDVYERLKNRGSDSAANASLWTTARGLSLPTYLSRYQILYTRSESAIEWFVNKALEKDREFGSKP